LKARKRFFKVFSTARKVLSCGAATPRNETPLARFHADSNPPRLTVADGGLRRLRSAHRSRKKPLRQNPLASAPCRCNTPRVANHGDAPTSSGEPTFLRPACAAPLSSRDERRRGNFAKMNEYKRNSFECCGAKLPGKWKACPMCQQKIPRREMTEKELCLHELDRMLRVNVKWVERNARTNPEGATTRRNRIAWIERFIAAIAIEGTK
jgi:hypothetical protein